MNAMYFRIEISTFLFEVFCLIEKKEQIGVLDFLIDYYVTSTPDETHHDYYVRLHGRLKYRRQKRKIIHEVVNFQH